MFFNLWKTNISKEPVKPREIINIADTNEIFEYLLFNLPISFYNNSNDWKMITILLKKFELSTADFKKWNEKSVFTTSNTNWTISQNETYYEQIDINKCKSGKTKFKEIIEKHLQITIIFNNLTPLIEWLFQKTNISRDTIQSIQNNDTNKIINIGDYKYDTKSGFIKSCNNRLCVST